MSPKSIRNFSIIAHIDHGKSPLADRIIQEAKAVSNREFRNQILDTMDIERERGITIKSQTVALHYIDDRGDPHLLNLIDTPGHVDFTYEVSRALASCEGVLLLVDASQGVEAQTIANLYLALEQDLAIIPVINKIDLPSADIEGCLDQIERELGLDRNDTLLVSAKEGTGIRPLLEAVLQRVPPPKGLADNPLEALIFDSHYDSYKGTVMYVRLMQGRVRQGDRILFLSNQREYNIEEVGHLCLKFVPTPSLEAGEVGYLLAGIKTISDIKIGDTVTLADRPCTKALPGFKEVKPVVFSSIYPVASDDYADLTYALEKLKLNDASLVYEKDSSIALGFGFRCGFLGLLHLEIIQERLEREFDQSLIMTAPSVKYRLQLHGKTEIMELDNPTYYPDPGEIQAAYEPHIRASIITPQQYLGAILTLCIERRGVQSALNYLDERRVEAVFDLPLSEVIYDFYDRLKSLSRGYASFDYEVTEFNQTEGVKLDILVNGAPVDALSMLVHRERAEQKARDICKRLKDEIPRQQFKVPIQGAIGGKIISRETISPYRKDVLAKCYGGDISRKRKLLEKQKEGKKRMKVVGNVEIPQRAFLSVLKNSE